MTDIQDHTQPESESSEGKDQKEKRVMAQDPTQEKMREPEISPQMAAGGVVKDTTEPSLPEESKTATQDSKAPAAEKFPKEHFELLDQWRSWCLKKYGNPGIAWRKMDINKSGTLSCTELINQCTSWRPGPIVRKVFNLLNAEKKDGVIVWSEFVGAALPLLSANSAHWVSEAAKAKIKDAPRKPATPPPELTKEEKIQVAVSEFQDWCVSTFDSPAAILAHFDTNGNGDVSCAEFTDRCGVPRRGKPACPGSRETLKAIFAIFDADHSGVIGKAELSDPLKDKFACKKVSEKDEVPAQKKSPKSQKILKQLGVAQGEGNPIPSPRPKNPGGISCEHEWTKRTVSNLRGAESLSHDLTSHLRDHVLAGDGGLCKVQQRSVSLSVSNCSENKARRKIAGFVEAAKGIEHQIAGLIHAGAEMKKCVKAMRNAHRALWRTFSVCETRLDLREARPAKEHIRDSFQKALEDEWEVTFNAREDLLERISKGERMISALEGAKEQLTIMMHSKRRDVRVERSQMMAERSPRGGFDGGCSLSPPSTVGSGGRGGACFLPPAVPEDTMSEGQNAQMDEKTMLARAARLEEITRKLCADGDAAIVKGKEDCREAVAETEQQMDDRIRKVGQLKDALQQELVHTQDTIHEAELSFGCSHRSAQSVSGSVDGDFSAPLSSHISLGEMDNEGDSFKFEADSNLPKKWQATANVLCRLKKAGAGLQEDLKLKVQALRIDGKCRKVTPRYASTELGRLHPGDKLAKVPWKNKQVHQEAEKTFSPI
jgi:hypothetical protein